MKHLFLMILILTVSVMTTACINNFAVQELNHNAQKYINKGDIDSAICRLKSSIELDNQVWETHYNLAIAYTHANDYQNAIKELKKTRELNPSLPDIDYLLGVCFEQLADKIKSDAQEKEVELTDELRSEFVANLEKAKKYYSSYLEKITTDNESDKIKERISSIEEELSPTQKE